MLLSLEEENGLIVKYPYVYFLILLILAGYVCLFDGFSLNAIVDDISVLLVIALLAA